MNIKVFVCNGNQNQNGEVCTQDIGSVPTLRSVVYLTALRRTGTAKSSSCFPSQRAEPYERYSPWERTGIKCAANRYQCKGAPKGARWEKKSENTHRCTHQHIRSQPTVGQDP